VLRCRNLALVPPQHRHFSFLYRLENDPDHPPYWSARRRLAADFEYETIFRRQLVDYYHLFFVIELNHIPIGIIYSFDANLIDGFCFSATALSQDKIGRGFGARAAILFHHHLFMNVRMRKVYTDILETNLLSASSAKSGFFVEEGRFDEHRLVDGCYRTLIRYALYKEKFIEHLLPVYKKLVISRVLI